jgi:hypothetical protein
MERFHEIDGGGVIIHSKGVYQQRKLFRRGDYLYAGHGTGFVQLYARGGTSVPTVMWKDIDPGPDTGWVADAMGRLMAPLNVVAIAS